MSQPSPRATVLVADDEPLTRWALKRTLEQVACEVTLAGSRDEVYDLLASRAFLVVVAANALGHNSMIDVLGGLSCDGQTRGLVILYDGENADDVRRRFPSAVLVEKPFTLEAVTAAVEGFVRPVSEAC